jgi:DNA replication and repair protein RecF
MNLSPGLNYLIGPNGSGKTSVLEAMHLLGLGRSFRSAQLNRVIQHHAKELAIFAELTEQANPSLISKLGFSRDQLGKSRMKVNGDPVSSMADLAQLLPILLLYSESYTLFRDSPKARRKWLDWGMFHVEHAFFPLWKKSQKILAQRNALLKQMASEADIVVWDAQLVEIAEAIHQLRAVFMVQWQEVMQQVLQALFDRNDLLLTYTPGWDVELGLAQVLKRNLGKDRALRYTTRGPQRADIQIYIEDVPAQHVLSLGQQKLLVSGIILSQAVLLRRLANKNPLLLIDDLPAELDEQAREKIARIIHSLDTQVFLTAIDHHTLAPFLATDQPTKMFHVEHGVLLG